MPIPPSIAGTAKENADQSILCRYLFPRVERSRGSRLSDESNSRGKVFRFRKGTCPTLHRSDWDTYDLFKQGKKTGGRAPLRGTSPSRFLAERVDQIERHGAIPKATVLHLEGLLFAKLDDGEGVRALPAELANDGLSASEDLERHRPKVIGFALAGGAGNVARLFHHEDEPGDVNAIFGGAQQFRNVCRAA